MKHGWLVTGLLIASIACGGEASVSVSFTNAAGQALSATVTPEEFGAKMVSVYLAESTDPSGNPTGKTAWIWVNPACADVNSCDSAPADDVNSVVEDYFEFARTTEEVNAELNSQGLVVEPMTYEWVRVAWCRDCGTIPTTRYRVAGWPAGDYVEYNKNATVSDSRLDPPLVVEDGDTVVVELTYDLTGMVVQEDSFDPCSVMGEPSCYSTGSQRFYIPRYIEFVPSARKQNGD